MCKKQILLVLCLVFSACAISAERPPEPKVPFTYDPNLCAGPVLDWVIVEPNTTCVYPLGVWTNEPLDPNDPNAIPDWPVRVIEDSNDLPMTVKRLDIVTKHNGGSIVHFQIGMRPDATPQLYYVDIVITRQTVYGPANDTRTLLILAAPPLVTFLVAARGDLYPPLTIDQAADLFEAHAAAEQWAIIEPLVIIH